MGDALVPLAGVDGDGRAVVEEVMLTDAVCIPECPHDILAPGQLLWKGWVVTLANTAAYTSEVMLRIDCAGSTGLV